MPPPNLEGREACPELVLVTDCLKGTGRHQGEEVAGLWVGVSDPLPGMKELLRTLVLMAPPLSLLRGTAGCTPILRGAPIT